MTSLLASLVIGGALGALLGRLGGCSSNTCPLTANWKRGALYGAVLGWLFHAAWGGGSYQPPKNIKVIAETAFDAEVLRAGKPVLVDFYAPWCASCKTLAPRLDKLAGELGERVKFVAVNVDQTVTLPDRYGVEGIPFLLLVNADGTIKERLMGLPSAAVLRAKLEALMDTENAAPAG